MGKELLKKFKKENILEEMNLSNNLINFVLSGTTGVGKSTLITKLTIDRLSKSNDVVLFDLGGSYKHLCKAVDGKYSYLSLDDKISLNFFTNLRTNEEGIIPEKDLKVIVSLICMMANSEEDSELISSVIKEVFRKKGNEAGMEDVLFELEKTDKTDLILKLKEFGNKNGKYYSFFNGKNDFKLDNSFTVFDFEKINEEKFLKIYIGALLQNISLIFNNSENEKFITIDESWNFTKTENQDFLKFLNILSSVFKENKTSFGIVIQMLNDVNKNQVCIDYYKSVDTKILMQQYRQDSLYKEILNDLESDFFKGLKNDDILISNIKEAIIVKSNFDKENMEILSEVIKSIKF